MAHSYNIVLAGCGKMGAALLHGWLDAKISAQFSVIEPHAIEFQNIPHFKNADQAADALTKADAIILAVKPQSISDLCAALAPHINSNCLILSIAAGQSLQRLSSFFETKQPVIRAMANTPAAIGKGMSVAVTNAHVTSEQKSCAALLLKTAGLFEWVEDETLLDAVTALSGSGPAYIFLLIETLAKAGEKTGLPPALALQLARQTVIGAAALAESDPRTSAETLRKNVTSPGGTTEAALRVLMDGRLQKLFDEALKAACRRSAELNTELPID